MTTDKIRSSIVTLAATLSIAGVAVAPVAQAAPKAPVKKATTEKVGYLEYKLETVLVSSVGS